VGHFFLSIAKLCIPLRMRKYLKYFFKEGACDPTPTPAIFVRAANRGLAVSGK